MYSIGEEISSSYTIALAWSPPGLAKHRRCALAVLTANLILSIWASDGKPQDESSWDRRQIVNDALEAYFGTASRGGFDQEVPQSPQKLRLRKRIRAFSWAPAMQAVGLGPTIGTQQSWNQQGIIAVSNDDNHVVIVAINSPTSTLGVEDSWTSHVLGHFSLALICPFSEPGTFDELIDQQRHISQLKWSPWTGSENSMRSVLAYATNDDVRARVISYSADNISFGPEIIYPNIELRFAGPLDWSPRVGEDGSLTLALFTSAEVVCLSISPSDASILNRMSHNLDERWDLVSGIAWDVHPKGSQRLHFSSQTMTTRCPTAALELSSNSLTSTPTPYWVDQISGSQGHFSAHHDLKGNANAKVWGLSASPLGNFVAACYTVHPTDMIEYGTPNDRQTTIAVSNLWDTGAELNLPVGAVSAEAIFSTVRKWVESNVESAEELPIAKLGIQKKLIEVYTPKYDVTTPTDTMSLQHRSTGLLKLLHAFNQDAFLDPNMIKDRYEILTSCICTPAEVTEIPRTLIAFRLAKTMQKLPPELSLTHVFSARILECSHHVIRLIEDLIDISNDDIETATPPPSTSLTFQLQNETCTFCDAPIPFTNISSATCTNGHEFTRCGLSFLTIQAPGYTKYCGLCNAPFFSDEYVLEHCTLDSTRSSASVSLDNELGTSDQVQELLNPETLEGNEEGPTSATVEGSGQKEGLVTQSEHKSSQAGGPGNEPSEENRLPQTDVPMLESSSTARQTSALRRSGPQPIHRVDRKVYSRDIPVTLARVLFLACDVCIYCGGKYVG